MVKPLGLERAGGEEDHSWCFVGKWWQVGRYLWVRSASQATEHITQCHTSALPRPKSHRHHLEDQGLPLPPGSKLSNSPQVCNSQGSVLAPSNFWLFEKFALRIEIPLFSPQRRYIFSGFKEAWKSVLIFLDRLSAEFSRLLISKS
jgi:hypothetical protein